MDTRRFCFAAERLPPNARDASRGAPPWRARLWSERYSLDVDDDARVRPWAESVDSRANRPHERGEDPSPQIETNEPDHSTPRGRDFFAPRTTYPATRHPRALSSTTTLAVFRGGGLASRRSMAGSRFASSSRRTG